MRRFAWWLSLAIAAGSAWPGCSAQPPAPASSAQPASSATAPPASAAGATPACVDASTATPAADRREAVAALQRAVEGGPLFTVTSAGSRVTTCRFTVDGGATSLEYQFADGGMLQARYDADIELNDQEVRLTTAPTEDAVGILTRAERAAYSSGGCDIDWQKTEARRVEDQPGSADTVYRGRGCNCQAWIRRDTAGQVVGLGLRSAC